MGDKYNVTSYTNKVEITPTIIIHLSTEATNKSRIDLFSFSIP